jgi:hypothetical protein
MSMKQEQGIDEVLHEEPRHIEDDEIEDPTCFEELPPSSPNPSIKFDDHEPSW